MNSELIIKRSIEALGLRNQNELANILNVSQKTISSWSTGRTEIRLKIFIEMANDNDLSVDYILYGKRQSKAITKDMIVKTLKKLPFDEVMQVIKELGLLFQTPTQVRV